MKGEGGRAAEGEEGGLEGSGVWAFQLGPSWTSTALVKVRIAISAALEARSCDLAVPFPLDATTLVLFGGGWRVGGFVAVVGWWWRVAAVTPRIPDWQVACGSMLWQRWCERVTACSRDKRERGAPARWPSNVMSP